MVTYTTVLQGFALARRAKDVSSTNEEVKHKGIGLYTVTSTPCLTPVPRQTAGEEPSVSGRIWRTWLSRTLLRAGGPPRVFIRECSGRNLGQQQSFSRGCPRALAVNPEALSISRVHPRALLVGGLCQHDELALEPLACPSASAQGRKASMSLPWSLSPVYPRAL